MMSRQVLDLIQKHEVEFFNLRFADMLGKQHHLTCPASGMDESIFKHGKMFDGSSISGWKGIDESDMVLLPDPTTAYLDPFSTHNQLIMYCDVLEPKTMKAYHRDPRSIAKRAEAYLKDTGIADTAYFGPEPEFFVFDSVRWQNDMERVFYEIESQDAIWSSSLKYKEGNMGHRPAVKGGYFPIPPVDALSDLRSDMCKVLQSLGQTVEVHHHEVATGGQCEISVRFNSLLKKADELMTLKYVAKNVAHQHGKTATFMPKPLVGDNGSGMHVHQSLFKNEENLFAGDRYGGLSQTGLWYIGGIFRHARAINAFANASTNSYKRLVPGFEAPVILAYSEHNRSASCRIPYTNHPKARRIEMRFPDSMQSGYLVFTALMMAGLDGILNQMDPGEPATRDLYRLSPEEEKQMPRVCPGLEAALEALDKDRAFLKAGNIMNDDFIDAYIDLKMQDVTQHRASTHPLEFQMYYSF